MRPFPLKIVTPNGIHFEGQAESLTVRTITGDIGILADHTNLVAPLSKGTCTIVMDGTQCSASYSGGLIAVMGGKVTLLSRDFEQK